MASERVTVEDVTDVSEEEEEEAGAARPAVEKPKDKNEMKGTVCIFSPYLNKNKTIQEGRRIPSAAACDDPTAWEIMEVCKRIFPPELVEGENKGYSRDYEAQWQPMRGRIRVRLFDKDGKPTHPEIQTRKKLWLAVSALIPKGGSYETFGKPTHPEIQTRKKLWLAVSALIPKIASRQPG
ncbi:signal recognition particle, SRP19 subunit [Baffinella frigidus]|nr:signal recognition particle, SRP19 subunit [Cryptophyta sp. CCMP2293]